uniref:Uncharacterized protein n=1 Tax=Anopheles darlingi TaxID=43151 RepID=A0A2M4D5A9_ANODA
MVMAVRDHGPATGFVVCMCVFVFVCARPITALRFFTAPSSHRAHTHTPGCGVVMVVMISRVTVQSKRDQN